MTIHDVVQRSPDWYALRAGRVTGTTAADMLATIKKGEAAARRDLRMRLVCERLTGQPADNGGGFQSAEMRWGVDHERAARRAYEARRGDLVRSVGFVTHDTLAAGCSPDGIVGDGVGLVEIKCPKSSTHFATWAHDDTIPADHVAQIRHNLWITGCRWCDFVSYDPRFPLPLRLVIIRAELGAADAAAYELLVRQFLAEVDRDVAAAHARIGTGIAA